MAEKYLAKKDILFKYLEDTLSAIREAEKTGDVTTISNKYSSAEITFPDLVKQFDELNLLFYNKKKDVPDQSSDYVKALDMFGEIKNINNKFTQNSISDKPVPTKIKLPPIEIPVFNGEPTNWKLFKESFETLIHQNHKLTPTQKVQYLISRLQGKAVSICAGIDCTGNNYDLLWNALVTRYDDPRNLATLYFNKLMSFQSRKIETPTKLTEFLDEFCSVVESLRSLKLDNLEDFFTLNIALAKLPAETIKAFETSIMHKENSIPTYSNLVEFVRSHIKMLNRFDTSHPAPIKIEKSKTKSFFVNKTATTRHYCPCCKKDSHPLYRCEKFIQLCPQDRYNIVRQENICLNCLNNKHVLKNCPSQIQCNKCGKLHHTLLHFRNTQVSYTPLQNTQVSKHPTSSNANPSSKSSSSEPSNQVFCSTTNRNPGTQSQTVLLSTVRVRIRNNGTTHLGRFLLDSGSQSNFITSDFCKKIGLHYDQSSPEIHIAGMDSMTTPVLGKIDGLKIESIHDEFISYSIDSLVVRNITDKLPSTQICSTQVNILYNLPLADDSFGIPGKIDGLIGGSLYPYIMLPGQVKTTPDGPIALNTTLGYVVLGNAKSCLDSGQNKSFCGFIQNQNLDTLVQKFWENEEITVPSPILSKDEMETEEHFRTTCQFDSDKSRYSVRLPFKKPPDSLGSSREIALSRFHNLERKLKLNPDLAENYDQAISELMLNGCLEICPDDDNEGYYVPHHVVVKKSSLTTKYRIVFDFSCKTSNGIALNDIMHCGPKLYTDLFNILLNFRLFKIALVADVAKMFLQISIHPDDLKYQKIFWRSSSDKPLLVYFLKRVTFGNTSSPFLAQRVIRQLALDNEEDYPLVKPVVFDSFYMDDLTLSVPTTQEALNVQRQLIDCFKKASFDLVKWSSNTQSLLDSIPRSSCVDSLTDWNPDQTLKILGMYWNNSCDQFSFGVTVEESVCTKRSVLSNLAKIWDPLGLISPVTVHCKILLQSLWSMNLDWDEPAPPEISYLWKQIIDELKLLSEIKIPRHISVVEDSKLTLIGYCDASEKACAAVVYTKVQVDEHLPVVTLLAAKSKVAPLKKISIPRLELNAALLLARLISLISNQYTSRYPVQEVVCLSDSTIALHWISASPHKWQTYVANRVSKIQELIPPSYWYHTTTQNNSSADCLSRGLLPSQLLTHPTWFSGPPYLSDDRSTWPITTIGEPLTPLPEEKKLVLVTVTPKDNFLLDIAKKYSSWSKILHILVYVFRFLKKLPIRSHISVEDLKFVELKLLSAVQDKYFGKDYTKKYANLTPFKDDDGMIRVGGRLSNSILPFENKHPILLPKEEHLIRLLVIHV